jgi:hypothetical protein
MKSNGAKCDARRHLTTPQRVGAVLLVIASIAVPCASAQESRLLTKSEVEGIAVGKKLSYVRATDGATVVFDVREGGKVYYSPARTQRNLSIGGTYTIGDDGSLCFKWEADKYVTMKDGCFLFKREGTKTHVVGGRNPDSLVGELVE